MTTRMMLVCPRKLKANSYATKKCQKDIGAVSGSGLYGPGLTPPKGTEQLNTVADDAEQDDDEDDGDNDDDERGEGGA